MSASHVGLTRYIYVYIYIYITSKTLTDAILPCSSARSNSGDGGSLPFVNRLGNQQAKCSGASACIECNGTR